MNRSLRVRDVSLLCFTFLEIKFLYYTTRQLSSGISKEIYLSTSDTASLAFRRQRIEPWPTNGTCECNHLFNEIRQVNIWGTWDEVSKNSFFQQKKKKTFTQDLFDRQQQQRRRRNSSNVNRLAFVSLVCFNFPSRKKIDPTCPAVFFYSIEFELFGLDADLQIHSSQDLCRGKNSDKQFEICLPEKVTLPEVAKDSEVEVLVRHLAFSLEVDQAARSTNTSSRLH